MLELSEKLRGELFTRGASVVGYADLSDIPVKSRLGFAKGISIGTAINPEVIQGISRGPTAAYYAEYNRLNRLLNSLALYAADFLRSRGYKAHPQTMENVIEDESTWRTPLPHKTVATRAGLGWIGNCALLVTERFGSAIRITSVITDADLPAARPVDESRCGDCMLCRDACPGLAVKGENWSVNKDRDSFFNPFDCRKAARGKAAVIGLEATLCGMCIYVCP